MLPFNLQGRFHYLSTDYGATFKALPSPGDTEGCALQTCAFCPLGDACRSCMAPGTLWPVSAGFADAAWRQLAAPLLCVHSIAHSPSVKHS